MKHNFAAAIKKFYGGVHPDECKKLSLQKAIESISMPERLFIPLHQHIGAPSEPCVKTGDKVFKGELLGSSQGFVSSCVHAPTSGIVLGIEEHIAGHPSGLGQRCIVLEPDGNDQWHPELTGLEDPLNASPAQIIDKIRQAGVVGLGGASFPSFIKMSPPQHQSIDMLIINGVECEPYLTCDARVMEERSEEIVESIRIMLHALGIENCAVGIENNKPGAIQAMNKAVEKTPNIRIYVLPVVYPQGAEKMLIEAVTGRQIPAGKLPIDFGVIVHNVATALAIRNAVLFGHPLIDRVVTVTGLGINRPANLEVLIGTPVQSLIDHCGGLKRHVKRVVLGGPMMGVAIHDFGVPVVKGTSGVLAMLEQEMHIEPEQPCIRCGYCVQACPMHLVPCEMALRARHDLIDQLQEVNLLDCIECGSCAYVCPANIPLVHYFRYGKMAMANSKRVNEKKELTSQRSQAKQNRMEFERAEKERKKQEMRLAVAAKKTESVM